MLGTTDPLTLALELAFVVYAVGVTGFIVLEKRRPTATIALVLSVVFVPIVGLLVYVLFSRRTRRRVRRRQRRPINPVEETRHLATLDELPANLPDSARGLVRLALHSAAAPLRRGEEVRLLTTAASAFEAFSAAIRSATRSIHCEFYIWHDDETARRLTAMLTERAEAGVKVRVLYDHLGSLGLPDTHFEKLRAAGGEIAVFGRLRVPMRLGRVRFNYRNHRKIMTVDGRLGILGGLNIGNEYLDPTTEHRTWRDLAISIEGDAVIGLEAIFLEDWLASTGEVLDLSGERASVPHRFDPRRPLPKDRAWTRKKAEQARAYADEANPFHPKITAPVVSQGPLLQIIPSGPDLPLVSTISAQFSAAIATANKRVWLATPYFIPDEPLMLILRTAALRGVDLRILVPHPRHNDVRVIGWAARSYYDEVLGTGGRIFEYERGMLHAKLLIVDDICALGSANMDIRSFHINYEVTGMFYDPEITGALAEVFSEDLEGASEVKLEDRADPSLKTRLLESGARVLSPLL